VEAGRDQGFVSDMIGLVTGELLDDEAIIGLVLVERADHVVPVAPGLGVIVVMDVAPTVGVARDVQPVPPPTLAVVRRRKQPVDPLLPGVWRRVPYKRLDFRRRR